MASGKVEADPCEDILTMSALKKLPRGAGRGICGGVDAAHTLTYTGLPLAVDLFSVDSTISTQV